MPRTLTLVAAVAAISLSVTGCVNRFQDDAQRAPSRTTSPFDNALAQNYIKLSNIEYQQGDQRDGDTYALRAIAARNGQPTQPDDLRYRSIPSAAMSDVQQGRQRLVAALQRNGRAKPEVAAYAQASFDCWVEQLDENIQPDHIAACRSAFQRSLAELEIAPPPPPAAAAPPPSEFMVFFDWDKYNITPEAARVLDQAMTFMRQNNVKSVTIIGHTDTSGSYDYNLGLSKRRADAVARFLEQRGIPANVIQTSGVGERDLLVPTADGVREAQNRRAVISFPKVSADGSTMVIKIF